VLVMSRFPGIQLAGLSLFVLLGTIACSPKQSATSPPPSTSLTSGTNPWPGYAGHYVALKQDLFKKEGINVKEQYFQTATETITAFLAHKVDIAWVTSGDATQIIAKEPSAKIIYLVDYSNGSDGILGRNIKSPKEIKGKTIARENLLFENVLLRAFLAKGGLTEKDVILKDMPAADAATAFSAKRVDAAVTYDPYLNKVAKAGDGMIIFDTKGTNLVADVLIAHKPLIDARKSDIQAYFRALDQGVKQVNSAHPEALQIVANKLEIKLDEAKEQLAGVKIFDLEGNRSIGFNPSNPNNLMRTLDLTVKTAVETKLLPKPIETKAMYDDSLINSN
jgi:NitT/TauT family transport system substrate-binding protein